MRKILELEGYSDDVVMGRAFEDPNSGCSRNVSGDVGPLVAKLRVEHDSSVEEIELKLEYDDGGWVVSVYAPESVSVENIENTWELE